MVGILGLLCLHYQVSLCFTERGLVISAFAVSFLGLSVYAVAGRLGCLCVDSEFSCYILGVESNIILKFSLLGPVF